MNKVIVKYLLSLLIISGLISCATQQNVVSFTNDDANFKKFQSYNIVNYKKGEQKYSLQGELFVKKIEAGITDEMLKKNYEKSTNPDIIVRYEVISSVNVETNNSNNPQFNSYGRTNQYNQYNPYDRSNNATSKVIEGVLLIELKDRETKKLIWQASLDLKYSKNKNNEVDMLSNAIQMIFNKYHYEAGSDKPITQE
jgi:hypothetical protein